MIKYVFHILNLWNYHRT